MAEATKGLSQQCRTLRSIYNWKITVAVLLVAKIRRQCSIVCENMLSVLDKTESGLGSTASCNVYFVTFPSIKYRYSLY